MSEEAKMDAHTPRRRWPGFVKEVGIVVLGVGLALAAQQTVDWLRDRARAADARLHIRAEISRNLYLVDLRAATEACVARRLDEVGGLIAASAAATLPKGEIWIGHPFSFAVLDGRYKAATQTGSVSLFSDQEQAEYAELYEFLAVYYTQIVGEQIAWGGFKILEDHPAASPALDLQLRNAVKSARLYRYYIQTLEKQINNRAREVGFVPIPVRNRVDAACLPLNTPRVEAQRRLIADRADKGTYDEP